MTLDINQFIKDITLIDLQDICSDWQWLLKDNYTPIIISCSGDMFLTDSVGMVYLLDTGLGQLFLIADGIEEFNNALEDIDNFDEWLLASTVLDLLDDGIILKENEVYGWKQMPILNGSIASDNMEPTDISVHFSITGQICQQILNPNSDSSLK